MKRAKTFAVHPFPSKWKSISRLVLFSNIFFIFPTMYSTYSSITRSTRANLRCSALNQVKHRLHASPVLNLLRRHSVCTPSAHKYGAQQSINLEFLNRSLQSQSVPFDSWYFSSHPFPLLSIPTFMSIYINIPYDSTTSVCLCRARKR